MRYRPDIDGLRALAVVPVVLFHAGFSWCSGGYVGVDVFFVISGYLITSIILSDLDLERFSIVRFYERRIRRIFPALFTVIAFCIAAGFIVMTPADYRNLGQSVIAAVFFVSNIFFWRDTGYFDIPSGEKPLLHTWSLSVEEQFYLLYPLLMIFATRFGPRARNWIMGGIAASSFLVAAVFVYVKPSAIFYLGPPRAWELIVGGLIAMGALPSSDRRMVNSAASGLGLVLIGAPVALYSSSTTFPGLAALPPVLGAALIIWSGLGERTFVHQVLSTNPFALLGKASYSLYLWHFPLLVFASYCYLGKLSASASSAVCVLAVAISFVSLNFVERPFRFPSKGETVRWPVVGSVLGMLSVCSAGVVIVLAGGLPGRMDAAAQSYLQAEADKDRHHMECLTLEAVVIRPQDACRLGVSGAQPQAILWGDSHSAVTASALEDSAIRKGAAFLYAGSVDCPIGIGFEIDASRGSPNFVSTPGYRFCKQYNEEMLQLVLHHPGIRKVVLSSRWTNWRIGEPGSPAEAPVDIRLRDDGGVAQTPSGNKAIFSRGFDRLLKLLTEAGKEVWIVGPVPEPSVRVPKALYIKHLGLESLDIDIPRKAFDSKNAWIFSFFAELARTYPIKFIWPHEVLCSQRECRVSENGRALYFDHNHLSLFGAQKTSLLYDQVFSNKE